MKEAMQRVSFPIHKPWLQSDQLAAVGLEKVSGRLFVFKSQALTGLVREQTGWLGPRKPNTMLKRIMREHGRFPSQVQYHVSLLVSGRVIYRRHHVWFAVDEWKPHTRLPVLFLNEGEPFEARFGPKGGAALRDTIEALKREFANSDPHHI